MRWITKPYKLSLDQMGAKLHFCYINRAPVVEFRLTLFFVQGNTCSDVGMVLADDSLYGMKCADTKVICQIFLKRFEPVKLIFTSTAVCITGTQEL